MMPNLALLQKSSLCTFIIAGFFLQDLVRVQLAEIRKSKGVSVCRKPRKGASSRMK